MRVGTWLAVGVLTVTGVLDAGTETARSAPASAPSTAPTTGTEAVRRAAAHLAESVQPAPDGSVVIANARYRAVFSSRDGIVYTPRVGGSLEPRLAWGFRVRALATETGRRPLDAVTPGVSATGDHVVDFARPGIVERYEGEGSGVEQIFVLTERPAGRGDVRITGDVTFAGRMIADNGGLRFEAPGLPAFSYAAPVAFDADGQAMPVRVETTPSTLALVLDGAALDGARWPVTIDPMLGVTTVDDTEFEWPGVDIAYSPRRGEFLVVYHDANGLDPDQIEIRLRRYYEDGDAVGPPAVLSTIGGQIEDKNPRIACDEIVDRCLVVWQRETSGARVRAQLITSDGALVGAPFAPGPFVVNGFPAVHERFPRVVARSMRPHAAADPCFLVVWNEYISNGSYFAQFARVSGTGAALGETQAPGAYAVVDAAYDPFADRFLAVWKSSSTALAGGTVNPATGATSPVTVTSDAVSGSPRVLFDLASRRYLVAWRKWSGNQGLRGQLMGGGASPALVGAPFWLTVWGETTQDLSLGGIHAQNGRFLLTYTRTLVNTMESRMARVTLTGAVLEDTIVATAANSWSYFDQMAVSASGYLAAIGGEPWSVKLLNRGRRPVGMIHGDANDFDGDGQGDLYLYRPSTGQFLVRQSSGQPQLATFALGGEAHLPVVLDWDGDALADVGVFSIATGRWTIRVSSTGQNESVGLGRGGDIPVPGDYLGGVADEVAVWRPSTGEWFIRERSSPVVTTGVLGAPGDQPVPADDDNDGKRELRVFRPSSGRWLRLEVNGTGAQNAAFGRDDDVAFGGNFVGGAEADRATFRDGVWRIEDGGTGAVTVLGGFQPLPVTLDWNGDGLLDVGSWNEVSGQWFIVAAGQPASVAFGAPGDIPAGGQ